MFDPDATTMVQRIVLCCLVDLSEGDRTPADAAEIRSRATRLLETAGGQPVGTIAEADIARALNGLAEQGFVEEQRLGDRSPVGKGRPQYSLSVDTTDLRETLENDDVVGPILPPDE